MADTLNANAEDDLDPPVQNVVKTNWVYVYNYVILYIYREKWHKGIEQVNPDTN